VTDIVRFGDMSVLPKPLSAYSVISNSSTSIMSDVLTFFNDELGNSVFFLDSAICFAVVNHNNPYCAGVVRVNDASIDCYAFLAC